MNAVIKKEFSEKWNRYFEGADLPIVFYYSDDPGTAEIAKPGEGHHCMICNLAPVRNGKALAFTGQSIHCAGGRRYLGFSNTLRPKFEYFLSCGIPGEMEGERYIRTPEMVKAILANMQDLKAPAKYIIFKRWDIIQPGDEPEAVIFFATPDVLSGLFTLANFDQPAGNAVTTKFGAGCSSIVHQPLLESRKENPGAVLGMFDVSARPCVPAQTLTFSIPMKKFGDMVSYMDESFLITGSWNLVRKRIKSNGNG